MDVEKFVDGWTRKYHGNKGSLVDLVQAALAQDREEREKLPRWHCPSCGADTPMNDFDWADTLSADLVRIQKHWPQFNFYPKNGRYYIEDVNESGITVRKAVHADTPDAVVKAALQEIENEDESKVCEDEEHSPDMFNPG